jgi:hypothetical protein
MLGLPYCRRVGERFRKLQKQTQCPDPTAGFRFIGLIVYRKIVFVEAHVAEQVCILVMHLTCIWKVSITISLETSSCDVGFLIVFLSPSNECLAATLKINSDCILPNLSLLTGQDRHPISFDITLPL